MQSKTVLLVVGLSKIYFLWIEFEGLALTKSNSNGNQPIWIKKINPKMGGASQNITANQVRKRTFVGGQKNARPSIPSQRKNKRFQPPRAPIQ